MVNQSIPGPSAVKKPLIINSYGDKYQGDLRCRVVNSVDFIQSSSGSEIRKHARSFFLLLGELSYYPSLADSFVDLVIALHPRPVQWGSSAYWREFLESAVAKIDPEDNNRIAILYAGLREICEMQGDFENGIRYATLVLQNESLHLASRASALRYLYRNLRSQGRPNEAMALFEEYESRLSPPKWKISSDPIARRAYLYMNQCRLDQLRAAGRISEALELSESLCEIATTGSREHPELIGDLLTRKSTLEWTKGFFPKALEDVYFAIDSYKEAGDHFQAESLQSNLGLIKWSMGNLVEAEDHIRRAIRYFRDTRLPQLLSMDVGNLALVYLARCDLDKAESHLNEQIEIARSINFISELERAITNLALVKCCRGDYRTGLDILIQDHVDYPEIGTTTGRFLDATWMSLSYLKLGDPVTGAQTLEDAWAPLKLLHSPNLQCIYKRTASLFAPKEERSALLLPCLEHARRSQAKLEEAACLLLLSNLDDSPPERNIHWIAARRILESIGAAAWLTGKTPADPPFLPFSS